MQLDIQSCVDDKVNAADNSQTYDSDSVLFRDSKIYSAISAV